MDVNRLQEWRLNAVNGENEEWKRLDDPYTIDWHTQLMHIPLSECAYDSGAALSRLVKIPESIKRNE